MLPTIDKARQPVNITTKKEAIRIQWDQPLFIIDYLQYQYG